MGGTVKEAHLGLSARMLRALGIGVVRLVQRPLLLGPKPELDKPAIFACRHVGLMDPLVLMTLYSKQMIHPLAAQDYFEKNAFTRWFYPAAQCIPIDRKNHSPKWLEDSAAALAKGDSIIIYPEGHRNKEGLGLLPFHTGAVRLAALTGAQIIPVYNCFWKFPGRYRLAIGEPYTLPPFEGDEPSREWCRQHADDMRRRVAALGNLAE